MTSEFDESPILSGSDYYERIGEIPEDSSLLFFDLGTGDTGVSTYFSELVRISAKAGKKEFHFENRDGDILSRSSLGEVLHGFIGFLNGVAEGKPIVLATHNCYRFDACIILRELYRCDLLDSFLQTVVGFVDTLPILREHYGNTNSDLLSLAQRSGIDTDDFCRPLGRVRITEEVICHAGITNLFLLTHAKTIAEVALGDFVSKDGETYGLRKLARQVTEEVLQTLANNVITLEMLQKASSNADEFDHLVVPLHLSKQNPSYQSLLSAVKNSIPAHNMSYPYFLTHVF